MVPKKTSQVKTLFYKIFLVMALCVICHFQADAQQAETTELLRKFKRSWYENNYAEARSYLIKAYSIDTAGLYPFAEEATILLLHPYKDSATFPHLKTIDSLAVIYRQAIRFDVEKTAHWKRSLAALLLQFQPSEALKSLEDAFNASPQEFPLYLFEALLQKTIEAFKQKKYPLLNLLRLWYWANRELQYRILFDPKEYRQAAGIQRQIQLQLRKELPDCRGLKTRESYLMRPISDMKDRAFAFLSITQLQNCADVWQENKEYHSFIRKSDSSGWLSILAQLNWDGVDCEAAIATLNRAIQLEKSPQWKSYLYLLSAHAYLSAENPLKALGQLEQAIQTYPQWGEPYLVLSEVYIQIGKSRKVPSFDQKVIYWLAIEQCQIAKNIDPRTETVANARIFKYMRHLPSKEELRFRNLKPGDTYPVKSLPGLVVTVR